MANISTANGEIIITVKNKGDLEKVIALCEYHKKLYYETYCSNFEVEENTAKSCFEGSGRWTYITNAENFVSVVKNTEIENGLINAEFKIELDFSDLEPGFHILYDAKVIIEHHAGMPFAETKGTVFNEKIHHYNPFQATMTRYGIGVLPDDFGLSEDGTYDFCNGYYNSFKEYETNRLKMIESAVKSLMEYDPTLNQTAALSELYKKFPWLRPLKYSLYDDCIVTDANHKFELVNSIPNLYFIWHIAPLADEYLPLARSKNSCDPECFTVDTNSLKAIRLPKKEVHLLMEAVRHGIDSLQAAEQALYSKNHEKRKMAEKSVEIYRRISA